VTRKLFAIAILLALVVVANASDKQHKDYVPDRKTAESIADAVLVAHYCEERISAGRPLLVDGSNKDYWIVEVSEKELKPGGGPAVWINKHSGCLNVMDHMK
jgi:hypothetical protein